MIEPTPAAAIAPPPVTRTLPPAPGYFTSAVRIMDLSIGEMLWSKRTVFMLLIVGAPVMIALILRGLVSLGAPVLQGPNNIRMTGPAIFGMMIWIFYLRFTVPVLGVFYGTSLIADEVEEKTITYLFTRPIPKGAVLIGKYLAYLASTILVVLPSVMLVYLLVVPLQGSLGGSFLIWRCSPSGCPSTGRFSPLSAQSSSVPSSSVSCSSSAGSRSPLRCLDT
jgi:hypothetical protein